MNTTTSKLSSYRWIIVSLLFFATMINYFDRIVLSVVIPNIKEELHITDIQYSYALTVFQFTYMFGALVAGKFIDWVGTKYGYLLSIVFWSFAAAMNATIKSAFSLSVWRGLLGLGEAGNFPAAMKSISEWFPKHERSFATSLFNSGPSVAMITGAPIIAFITLGFGWRWAFIFMGLSGFVLAIVWPFIYKNPKEKPEQTPGGRESTLQDFTWAKLLKYKETFGIMLGKFLTDPVWWFYLFWLPNYLYTQRGFDIKGIAVAMPIIYIIAIILGNIGGWFPGYLIQKGWSVTKARKLVMFISAMCLPFTALAVVVPNVWAAVLFVSLACGAHSAWSHNIFAVVTDQFPSKAVGAVTGLSSFAGGVGGFLISTFLVGYIITYIGYVPIFILMGVLHPLAYVAVHFLIKKDSAVTA
jgi:MFS transporter, ACS family, hexuronate transporter